MSGIGDGGKLSSEETGITPIVVVSGTQQSIDCKNQNKYKNVIKAYLRRNHEFQYVEYVLKGTRLYRVRCLVQVNSAIDSNHYQSTF